MKKFLLVSTSRSFLQRNINLIQRRGLRIFTAASGEEALKLNNKHTFDLILSDLELEDMDGLSLCSQVRDANSTSAIPFILTGFFTPKLLAKSNQSGVSATIPKPIDPIKLLDTVGELTQLNMVRSKRVELSVAVIARVNDQEMVCESHDISNTGMLLEAENELALGARINCRLTMPDSIQIVADGEIIRSMSILNRKNLYGIRFTNLHHTHQRKIEEYVTSIARA